MRNHDEKRRDMCRSILPSTARKAARDNKALLKRSHRRHIRQQLHEWGSFDDPYDFEGFAHEDTNRPLVKGNPWVDTIQDVVDERRVHDKVGPLVRWVEAIKDDLPGEDDEAKFHALKKLLPDNLIGRHALSHVDRLFDLPSRRYHWGYWRNRDWDAIYAERSMNYAAWVEVVREVVKTDLGYMNRLVKSHGFEPCQGLDDVDRFAAACTEAKADLILALYRGGTPQFGNQWLAILD